MKILERASDAVREIASLAIVVTVVACLVAARRWAIAADAKRDANAP